VQLISGSAECFGVELAEGHTYTFAPGRKAAIFTWYGAELHTWGGVAAVYTAEDTPMTVYANLHQRLEARRDEAKATGGAGPRVRAGACFLPWHVCLAPRGGSF
jgi:polyribonucleotide 5'-hydroxyl-kinase